MTEHHLHHIPLRVYAYTIEDGHIRMAELLTVLKSRDHYAYVDAAYVRGGDVRDDASLR